MHDINWLTNPLFTNAGGADISVGIDSQGEWWVRSCDPRTEANETSASSNLGSLMLLPLMQPGYGGLLHEVKAKLERILTADALSEKLVSTFPFYAPVLLAYSNTSRWTDLASLWLPDVSLNEGHIYALSDSLGNHAISQRARQAANRKIREWERIHGICIIRNRTD